MRSLPILFALVALSGCEEEKTDPTGNPVGTPVGAATGTGTGAGTGTGTGAGTGTGTGTVNTTGTLDVSQFVGMWKLKELDIDDGKGIFTLHDEIEVLGSVTITATTGQDADLVAKILPIVGGLPFMGLEVDQPTITVHPGRVQINDPKATQIYETTIVGDVITWTWDAADPRNSGDLSDVAHRIQLERLAPAATEGSFTGTSMSLGKYQIQLGQCLPAYPGEWRMSEVALDIGADGQLNIVVPESAYSDAKCTVYLFGETYLQEGLWRDDSPGVGSMWMWETGKKKKGSGGDWQQYSWAETKGVLTLTNLACRPMPDCVGDAPSEVVLDRN